MSSWIVGVPVLDGKGLRHLNVTTSKAGADTTLLLCLGGWVPVGRYFNRVYDEGMVTCLVCAMFVVHDGKISLWVPR